MSKQTFGVIVSTRNFFPSHLVHSARAEITDLLNKLGHDIVMVNESDTHLGAILTLGEAKTCAQLFKQHAGAISGIIVILPNFGEELGIVEAIDRANLNVPILIQACDDDVDKLDMANRRDAFCGKISLCNNLYQRGIPFSLTAGHTCKITSDAFMHDVKKFAQVCNVVSGVRGSRIAMLGARPVAFNTVRFSEKILQKHGISVQTVDLSEVMALANSDTLNPAHITDKELEIKQYGCITSGIQSEKITKQARLCLAMEQFVTELDCQASTVQCWDSLEHNYGCAACLGMSMMGEKGKPSACESDVTGALSMLVAQLAAENPPALMDWNNNVADDQNTCISLHCSNFPKSFFQTDEVEIGCLDVLGSVLGQDATFGAVKAKVSEGPMTYVRFTTDDARGILKMYVGEGQFEKNTVTTKGGVALCRVERLQDLLKYICEHGYEHHVCFVRGHVADIIEEAMTKYMQVSVYRHQ